MTVVGNGAIQIAFGVLALGAGEEIFSRTLHPIGSVCPRSVNEFRRMLMFFDRLPFQSNFVSGDPACFVYLNPNAGSIRTIIANCDRTGHHLPIRTRSTERCAL